jgi:hypothetical protein
MKTIKLLVCLGLYLVNPLAQAELYIQPEYFDPECHVCYEQQHLCYEMDGKKCTENILPCVKSQCTHYKRPEERVYAF